MSFPTKNDILIGISFVFVGIIYALSERWMTATKFPGLGGRHIFDHFFLMCTLKQCLQLGLFIIWKAIDNNWLGCARFRHGDIVGRANPCGKMLGISALRNNSERDIDNVFDGNGHACDESFPDIDVYAASHDINLPINADADVDNDDNDEDESENKQLVLQHISPTQRTNKSSPRRIFVPPAIFAQAHMLLLYFGLKLTYDSSFIMLKGTVTFFTALLSMAFLAQQLACYVWFGVIVATLGFAVSGLSDYIKKPSGGYENFGIAAGNLLIVMAQIMFATKIIYEEKFIRKHSIHPMMFLGCEAIPGTIITVIVLLVFNFVDANQYSSLPSGRLEDVLDAIYQFRTSWRVILAVLGSLGSYILFTYLGLFLVRDHGALPRIMIETFVWSIFWAISLALKWEHFYIGQVPGLCVIAIGALIYSHILVLPFSSRNEGIDPNSSSFTNHFMNLRKTDNQPQGSQDEADQNDEHVGNYGAAQHCQDEDDTLLHREVVVELHPNKEDDDNQSKTDSIDEPLIHA